MADKQYAAWKADQAAQRTPDKGRSEAYAKYGIPSNFNMDAKSYAKIRSGEMTWDTAMAQLAGKPVTLGPATGTYGGPGGAATFTTAPGTVGGALANGGVNGGGGGGGGSSGGGFRDAAAEAALKRLEATGTGQDVPMDAAQQSRMLSGQSDMTAAAEAQQQAALRRTVGAGGGSLYDPSTGAAEREITADRQAANQGAKREIETDAQSQNWEAQFAANRLLAAQRDGGGRYDAANPYGDGGRYGGTTGSRPDRGGNVQAYPGYDLNPNKLNNTATQRYAKQLVPARQQWGAR